MSSLLTCGRPICCPFALAFSIPDRTRERIIGMVTGIDLHFCLGAKIKVATSVCTGGSRCPPDICIWMGSIPLPIKNKKEKAKAFSFLLVPVTGIEPVRILLRGILSPLCLPVPPHRRGGLTAMVSHFASTVKGHSWSRFSANAGRHSSMNQFSSGKSISFMACMVCTAAELNSALPAFCSSIHLA